ncbi:response regulator [Alkalibaculum sp. M08DMB]|uniref:Stage 0 sporulation protein A homolog n=1 Tax=Alkalibaculum sporogenes TaxID=2655001 RepID=A0A6A7KAV9_9FIRM|nr:response regulator transcription factor [Alkalibaculum sporogenes]MPW26658.1 response regulator [Alkalibaculum sporogenes]
MENLSVLICDDDTAILDAIEIFLVEEKYKVYKATNGVEALKILEEEEIQLIILDIMMPLLDGLSAMIKIRRKENLPIILLSAKSEDTDKIIGLNMGADDYVTKPFNSLELIARVKSQMRRYTNFGSIAPKPSVLRTGGLVLDTDAKEITVDGDIVKLTATEYGILEYLMKNMGRVFSINQIYEQVWNESSYAVENTVSVHIRRIREKIEINPKEPEYLKVVWGIGYKMERI